MLRKPYLLDHPNTSYFGTGLRNILLKNLPPATFFYRKMPSQGSNPSLMKTKNTHAKAWVIFWRRGRDSNPRTGISRYTISNRAP